MDYMDTPGEDMDDKCDQPTCDIQTFPPSLSLYGTNLSNSLTYSMEQVQVFEENKFGKWNRKDLQWILEIHSECIIKNRISNRGILEGAEDSEEFGNMIPVYSV